MILGIGTSAHLVGPGGCGGPELESGMGKKHKRNQMLSREALEAAAECLRILAHPDRLLIVQLLLSGNPYSVGDLSEQCGITQPQTSEHLRLMQRCGFLESQREGRNVYYSVSEPHLEKIMGCIESRFGSVTNSG